MSEPNRYSATSRAKLDTCHQDLQRIFQLVLVYIDHTILCGRRSMEEQDELFRLGRSQLCWPSSKHCAEAPDLSRAVDAAPYPIDWKDRERATLFAGYVLGIAKARWGIGLRWGGDWNQDWKVADNHFDDLWHFELPDGWEGK